MRFLNVLTVLALASVSLLAGCDGNEKSKADPVPAAMIVKQIDASSYTDYAYYNLTSQQQVANATDDWHIAFKRNAVILNSGSSGAESVLGAIADQQAEYYDGSGNPVASVFNSATEAGELSSIVDFSDASGLTYIEDSNRPQITGDGSMQNDLMNFGWYLYNRGNHQVSANTDAYWIVRSGVATSYARFRVTGLTQNGFVLDNLSVELHVQSVGSAVFDTAATLFTADFTTPATVSVCYDFDTKSAIACSSAEWDLRFDKNLHIWTNGGVYGSASSGAASSLFTFAQLPAYPNGVSVPRYFADQSGGIFLDYLFYGYNIDGRHQLKPNYRVYVVDTGTEKHKLQITSYYATGASGNYRIRHQKLN